MSTNSDSNAVFCQTGGTSTHSSTHKQLVVFILLSPTERQQGRDHNEPGNGQSTSWRSKQENWPCILHPNICNPFHLALRLWRQNWSMGGYIILLGIGLKHIGYKKIFTSKMVLIECKQIPENRLQNIHAKITSASHLQGWKDGLAQKPRTSKFIAEEIPAFSEGYSLYFLSRMKQWTRVKNRPLSLLITDLHK